MSYYDMAAFTQGCAWHGVCPNEQDSCVSHTYQNKEILKSNLRGK